MVFNAPSTANQSMILWFYLLLMSRSLLLPLLTALKCNTVYKGVWQRQICFHCQSFCFSIENTASTWSSDMVTGFGGLLFCSGIEHTSKASVHGGCSACAASQVLQMQAHDVGYSWDSLHLQHWLKSMGPKDAEISLQTGAALSTNCFR